MVYARGWRVHDASLRKALTQADAELSLVTAISEPERARSDKRLPVKRHVATMQIPDDGGRKRNPPVCAAYSPVELLRVPQWPSPLPDRLDPTARRDYGWIFVRCEKPLQPRLLGERVVVQERDHAAHRSLHATITRLAEPTLAVVRNRSHVRDLGSGPLEKLWVVIYHKHNLSWRRVLLPHRIDGRDDGVPAALVIRADDDCSRQVASDAHRGALAKAR